MQERADSILTAFRREPEATRWAVRFALAGPIVIVCVNAIASALVGVIATGIIDLLLILTYGLVLAYMIVRIMNASERWGVESALTARKISNRVQKRGEDEEDEELVTHRASAATASFQEAHFLRRLTEEVAAARRDGSHISLIWLDVSVPGADPFPAQVEKMATDVAELLASQSRTIGASVSLTMNEYVFSLPHHDKAKAHEFMRKLVLGLGKYWVHCGIAEYPKEVNDADALYSRARALCDASRQGKEEPAPARAM
jgi:hypothetical protein